MKKNRKGSRSKTRLKNKKFRGFSKISVSVIMILLMVITLFDGFSSKKTLAKVDYTSDSGSSSMVGFYLGSDGNGPYRYARDVAKRIIYAEDGTVSYIESEVATTGFDAVEQKYQVTDSDGNKGVAYCVEAGKPFKAGDVTAQRAVFEDYFRHIPHSCRDGIILALLYGYDGENAVPVEGCNSDDYRFATQVIIWEFQQQLRTSYTTKTIKANNWGVPADEFSCMLKGRPAEKCYNWIIDQIVTNTTYPSFSCRRYAQAQSDPTYCYTMKYDPVTKKYSITLNDTRGVKAEILKSNNNSVSISKNGNNYTFSTSKTLDGLVLMLQHSEVSTDSEGCLIWTSDAQTLITGKYDPFPFYFRLQTENKGTVKITKTSETGEISGIKFKISGEGVDLTVTTTADGTVAQDLAPGSYTVTELDVDGNFITPSAQTVTVESGKTATVSFDNKLKRGNVEVTKRSEDKKISGIKFKLSGTSDSGEKVSLTATTGTDGIARFSNVLIGTYKLEELDAAGHYIPTASQNITVKYNATVKATFNNNLKRGNVEVTKRSEDKKISGIKFRLSGTSDSGEKVDLTATTGADGVARFTNVLIGTYKLEELDAAGHYIPTASQNITVSYNTTAKATFNNNLKRGNVEVTKRSEDGRISGIKFRLYGTSDSGEKVSLTATTGADGIARFTNVLIGTYTLEEVDADISYVPTEKQNITVTYKGTAKAVFTNILKKWILTVTKTDAETGAPQSDAKLSGAVYGIYDKDGNLVDTYTTDGNGSFTTKEYACGSYTLKEITPPEGYTFDETVYPAGAEPGHFITEHNSLEITVKEQVIKGSISIIKHTDNGDTQIETPEEGAEFEIYLKTAGSYENAAESERDILTCDEYGFAQTKELPYGVYTVHQTRGWADTEYMTDFDVYISKDGKIMRYLINNKAFESYLKIVKLDAETGKTVPVAGAGYKIYDADGDLITMRFTYPQVTVTDTFYTNAEGFLITPEKLGYGEYTLIECEAPYGYILDPEPVKFTMDLASAEENGGVLTVTVKQEDMPQKGVISIIKYGEYLSSFMEENGLYTPVYVSGALSGAVFDIIAAEDIRTGDGSIRYAAGTVADTVTTDTDGKAQTKPLYLGKYIIKETKAPAGYVLSGEAVEVELTYAGETVEITRTEKEIENERQKAVISLKKLLEAQENKYGKPEGADITKVRFGLFSSAEITAADGTVLPAGALLESASVSADGTLTFKTDIPYGSYYVKELETAEGYILDETEYRFDFSCADDNTASVEITVNDGGVIENKPVYGTVKGIKTDEAGKPLGGALIGLFKPGTADFTKETAVETAVSAEDGSFTFEHVPYGTWIIREIESPEGYILSEKEFTVSVSEAGETVEIVLVNAPEPEPEPEPEPPVIDVPTGDKIPGKRVAAYIVLGLIISGLVAANIIFKKKRRK